MSIEVVSYIQDLDPSWDQFCLGAVNATFLHTRRFLSYHVDQYKDKSVLLMESGRIVGVFPAAVSLTDPMLIVSHPGATYGGVVHQGWLTGMRMVEALTVLCQHFARSGYQRLLYKAIPHIYHKIPSQDDIYALFRLGAQRVRCDLTCSIDLENRQRPSERRRRGLKKAQKLVSLSSDPSLLGELWSVIAENLNRKHNAYPVHSSSELALLLNRFPEQIPICCALLEGRVEAGVVFFNSSFVWHAQYIAASERGYEVSALDAVFEFSINAARMASAHYFDFGISNEDNGWHLNDGLYQFKSEFGGGGVVHEFYELSLENE